jgi:hypothetical protein
MWMNKSNCLENVDNKENRTKILKVNRMVDSVKIEREVQVRIKLMCSKNLNGGENMTRVKHKLNERSNKN